jgi:hypothetical protein
MIVYLASAVLTQVAPVSRGNGPVASAAGPCPGGAGG